MKYVSQFGLKEGCQKEYIRRHDQIWPEMVSLIQEAGLENYSIWNTGTMLIEYFECMDLSKAEAVISSSPVKKRWDEMMSDILVIPSGGFIPLSCMFDLDRTAQE